MRRPHLYKRKSEHVLINRLVYFSAIFYPLMTLPQVMKLYQLRSAHDLSLTSWLMYTIFELIFLVYGVTNKIMPLVVTGVLWLAMYALVILGILLYR